ncbi:MAG: MCE family protein [Frankiaceae bacterium]|nr:MCE family protein [Frankiaceae bacterium]MBV9871875.1 MCE family protein [Frankiaceae bacterium]
MSPARGSTFRQFRDMNPTPFGWVAIVVLIGMVALSFNLTNLPFNSGRSYSAAFSEAAGLRPGDQVEIGGVPVGKVKSVSLEDTHVKVDFRITNSHVHLGTDTKASIQIATLLGNKYLALEPDGTSEVSTGFQIPLAQTTSPYDVEPALQDLATTAGAIKTKRLETALNTLSTTFQNSPKPLRSTISGLSRLSETIASRNAALGELLHHTSNLTAILAQRRGQFTQILGDGDKLLTMLDQRRQVISDLLTNTSRLAMQLTGLVHDNQATLHPMLRHLHGVLALLNHNQDNLTKIIQELYVFVRGEVDATGSGPWFDGTAINVINPVTPLGNAKPSGRTPQTLDDLLGLGGAP